MHDILLCTVGTSLKGNIERLEQGHPLRQAYEAKNWVQAAKELAAQDPRARVCGAEVNSIASIQRRGDLSAKARLVFLVSDTLDGENVGQLLKRVFGDSIYPLAFEHVDVARLIGLRDTDPKTFRNQGLRNLVREIASRVKQYGANRIAINATGGYKAQIAFAALIGQALEIPVYYQFESFDDVIVLPPQPISHNFALWLEHYELLQRLSTEGQLPAADLPQQMDERVRSLLEEEEIDGHKYVALSPIGDLFHQSLQHSFRQGRERLLPQEYPLSERAHPDGDPRLSKDQHLKHLGLKGLAPLLRKIFENSPYIKGFHSHYTNPDLSIPTAFHLDMTSKKPRVELVFSEGGKTAKLVIDTKAQTIEQHRAVIADLTERFLS